MIDHYQTDGGRETMLRLGPSTGPVVVVALPLFEEANRVRAFAVAVCRALAKRGVASALPDMPGQGESLVPLCSLSSIRTLDVAFESVVRAVRSEARKAFVLAIRSGAIFGNCNGSDGRLRFAPQDGSGLLRDLKRIKQAASSSARSAARRLGEDWHLEDAVSTGGVDQLVEIAGNLIRSDFLATLSVDPAAIEATSPLRTVRLVTDAKPADRHVPGTPLWRRAEPGNDLALAALLADDIADWIATCGA